MLSKKGKCCIFHCGLLFHACYFCDPTVLSLFKSEAKDDKKLLFKASCFLKQLQIEFSSGVPDKLDDFLKSLTSM